MKALALITALLASSSAFAVLRDHYSCQDASGKIKVFIESTSRPDFDIDHYDSSNGDDENEGISSSAQIDDRDVEARIQTLAYKGGSIAPVQEKDDQGRTCTYGSIEQGAELKINLTVAGQTQTVELACSIETDQPRGFVECE